MQGTVIARKVSEMGETRWALSDIIGQVITVASNCLCNTFLPKKRLLVRWRKYSYNNYLQLLEQLLQSNMHNHQLVYTRTLSSYSKQSPTSHLAC
jgi:hypothetical protein